MPSFNINSCDHLGLKNKSQNLTMGSKLQKRLNDSLLKNKETLAKLEYIYSDYIEKYDAKLHK